MITFEALKADYTSKLSTMVVKADYKDAIDRQARRIIAGKDRYQKIEKTTGVPWQFIGILHYRESDLNFNMNLHNGEPLSQVTRLVPKGRGPFSSFEESAVDALTMKGKEYDKVTDWSLERQCYYLEMFNGFGYQGKAGGNPYLWGGSNHYIKGKYIRDHVYSASFVDPQLGTVPILKRINELDITSYKDLRVGSWTLTVLKQVKGWIAGLTGSFALGEWFGWMENVKQFAGDHWILLGGVAVLAVIGLVKFLEYRREQEYKAGNYTPSGG